jgi:carbon monoxide dehydrogenase subunit G
VYTFTFRAPLDRVWATMRDVPRAVEYLAGLDGVHVPDATTVLGRLTITTGATTIAYTGKATVAERDDVAHKLRLVAQGRDSAGANSAAVTITTELRPRPNDGCELRIDVEGAPESTTAAVVRGFAERLRASVESSAPSSDTARGGQPGAAALAPTGALPAYQTPPPPPRPPEPPSAPTRGFGHWLARLFGFGG